MLITIQQSPPALKCKMTQRMQTITWCLFFLFEVEMGLSCWSRLCIAGTQRQMSYSPIAGPTVHGPFIPHQLLKVKHDPITNGNWKILKAITWIHSIFHGKNEGHLVHITYKIFYWALELTNFLQCLVVPLDFVDVHGQVLEDKTKDPFCLETNWQHRTTPVDTDWPSITPQYVKETSQRQHPSADLSSNNTYSTR